jgi:hypothetical protein
MAFNYNFVDFDEITIGDTICDKDDRLDHKILYHDIYDNTTTSFYKNIREHKLNAIMIDDDEFEYTKAFKFEFTWNPFTGERGEKDLYGPLYFNPNELIYYFYKKRLNRLWIEPKDEKHGYYEGYYGDFVGSDMIITSRGGSHSDQYLFRLPINNCYLPKDCDMSIITMGPILNDDEIKQIELLSNSFDHKYFYQNYNIKKKPSLIKMKFLYDQAISKKPNISHIKSIKSIDDELYNKANRLAVDSLKIM